MITNLTDEKLEAKFRECFPKGFFLNKENISEAEYYLKQRGWIPKNDNLLSLEKPGEGNMNYVLRVTCENSGSFIIKQSRPWVEKYPQFEAPINRNGVEKEFLELLESSANISKNSPKVFGFDENSNILFTEDIVDAKDFTYVYQKEKSFTKDEIDKVIYFANELSNIEMSPSFPENLEMRKLNHQHIFNLPFLDDNGFPLDDFQSGLLELSRICTSDSELKNRVLKLGNVYLGEGSALQHGDLYPGSFLKSPKGVFVIDPEFAFFGPSEWDIAVFVAHLILAQTEPELVNHAIDSFIKPKNFDQLQFCGFIGTEIIRRLIGIAQLPLALTIKEKENLLIDASNLIKQGM